MNLERLIQKWLENNTAIDEINEWFNSMPSVNEWLNRTAEFLGIENWIVGFLTPIITFVNQYAGILFLIAVCIALKYIFRE